MRYKTDKQRKAVMCRLKKAGFSDISAKYMTKKVNGDCKKGDSIIYRVGNKVEILPCNEKNLRMIKNKRYTYEVF